MRTPPVPIPQRRWPNGGADFLPVVCRSNLCRELVALGRATWFLRWGLRHTLAFCSNRVLLLQFLVIRHLSVPLGTRVVKTFRWTPQVISDSDRAELNLLAARHGFTGVGCEVREIADRLLNAGVDSDDLVTIYLADADDRSTIVPAFERFLQTCDIAIPDRDTAVWGVLEHHISLIARRAGNPRDLCRTMVDEVYYQYDFRCNEYVGLSLIHI